MGNCEDKFWWEFKHREVSRILNFLFVLKLFADTKLDLSSELEGEAIEIKDQDIHEIKESYSIYINWEPQGVHSTSDGIPKLNLPIL